MRRAALVVAAVAFVALGVVSTPTPARAATHAAHVANTTFVDGAGCSPVGSTTTTVRGGDSVTWHNCDSYAHTVTADDMSFNRPLAANGNVIIVFTNAGVSIPYHCEIHPSMHGTIVVEAQQTTTGVTQPPTTKATTTTVKPSTTTSSSTSTSSTSTSTTQTTANLDELFGSTTSSSSSTTSTTAPSTKSKKKNDSKGLIIGLLVLAIAGVGAGAYAVWRRMQQTV